MVAMDHHSGITEDVISVICRTLAMLVLAKAALKSARALWFVVCGVTWCIHGVSIQCLLLLLRFAMGFVFGWCRCVTFQPSHLSELP